MKKQSQSGFAVLELLFLLVAVGVLTFTAVNYFNHRQQATTDTTGSVAATATVPSAPQINIAADLTTAENFVDQMDIDTSSADNALLDSELSNF